MKHITLLPGWALAPDNMQPLREALLERISNVTVDILPLPAIQLSSLETDLSSLAQQIKPGVLIGWSLGGMLAVQLHRRFPEHFPQIVTLAANACFVERKSWADAMPTDIFKAFYNDYRDTPEKTLKRFALLVTQGSPHARQLAKNLSWDALDADQRLHSLAVLGMLDNRVALSRPTQPMLHCLGALDALVPEGAAPAIAALHETSSVAVHPQAGHALPLEQPLWLAEEIAGWLESGHA
ncbi:malonyl-CoA O-methyltransferase/pimeloyl-[acyl-carrier protein] methyl ester esterase [Halopseudomonas litoralis]|uniref:Malonyl-CoA O-methyltransferase/pimeloyl-[acyl-carrier protein] methyl ester esterase n=1 Tax=Halopseudomonas litoralis TaxID=797277 RepID=A0A1H1LIT5_9GAMM|nr:alpha/beta fold hydrolase [Halopseudomonas litoralis]SDR74426.1 malonyl-CoA O-methyltransferase/pimeloyl-[acyl-carrier protein] methyl ester esterase [Halopseudomonas litoralis]